MIRRTIADMLQQRVDRELEALLVKPASTTASNTATTDKPLDLAAFRKAMDELVGACRPHNPLRTFGDTLAGLRLVDGHRGAPRIQVRPDVPMTEEGRARMNAWLAERFGYHDPVPPRGTAYVLCGRYAVLHPDDRALLRTTLGGLA